MQKKLFFVLLITISSFSFAQDWTFQYLPYYRQIHEIHLLTKNHISAIGGWPSNDSITDMYFSDDGGETWQFQDIFPGKMIKSGLYYDSGNAICGGLNEVCYKTVDSGRNWVQSSFDVDLNHRNINKFSKGQWGSAYACGGLELLDGFVMKTENSGENWSIISEFPESELNSIYAINNNKIIVCGPDNFLMKTSNSGEDWTNCDIVNFEEVCELNAIEFFGSNIGYCVGGRQGEDSLQVVLKTIDGGATWSPCLNIINPSLNDVDIINDSVAYAVGDYGIILKTIDHGENWQDVVIADNPFYHLYAIDFINEHYGIIAGNYGIVFQYDDGETITPQAITLEAMNVTPHSAVLKANINPGIIESEVNFQYGMDESMGQNHSMGTYSGGSLENVSYHISGLQENTHYYYRVCLLNDYGAYYGDTKLFYTGNPIPNWDFELWTEDSCSLPDNWFMTQGIFNMAIYGEDTAVQICNHGSDFDNDMAVIMNAYIDGGNLESFHIPVDYISGGTPFTDRPDSLYVKMKYDIEPQDSALIFLGLLDGDQYVSENFFFIEGTETEFVHNAYKLEYLNANIPDRVVVAIVNTNPFDTTVFDNMLEISDIYFSGNTADIPNHDFSAWTDYNYFFPDAWFFEHNYSDSLPIQDVPFERTEDAAHHDYAIKLQNMLLPDDTVVARISLKDWDQGFPIDKRFSSFSGQYKYLPEAQDTARFFVVMYHNDEQCGWGHFENHESIANWTEFTTEIHYDSVNVIPDSMNITIETSQWPPTGESILYVDKLSMDGDYIPVNQLHNKRFNIFPNPAHETLYFSEPVKNIEIYNALGKKVLCKKGQHNSINISILKPGMYFFRADIDIFCKFVKK